MNFKIKFLQIMLSDLISERDTLELDLNRYLNLDIETKIKKEKINKILKDIALTNNKIEILSEYMSSLETFVVKDENNNNNN
jgi:hypothetical protein